MADDSPIDRFDPRFPDLPGRPDEHEEHHGTREGRALVASRGPGPSLDDPKVRILRIAIPLLALAGVTAVVIVFLTGLSPGSATVVVGPEAEVRAAVAERPYRYCYNGTNPCAWLTIVDGQVVAFNTNGPLAEEYGRQGVAWCPSSGYFGANATGSTWDQEGRIVSGPARRSLDRFTTSVDGQGNLVISFASLDAGLADWQVDGDVRPPAGPVCEQIPFDRAPDLVLGSEGPADLDAAPTTR